MRSRRILAAALAGACLMGGLAACGGTSSADLARQIDQQLAKQGDSNGLNIPAQDSAQDQAELDQRDAAEAKRRRAQLAKLDADRQAETNKIMKQGVPGGNDDDAATPIGAGGEAEQTFRAKLSGVCEGGQKRIHLITKAAAKAKKANDAAALLKVAQDYNSALNDFQAALVGLKAPKSMQGDYAAWLATIAALGTNIRVQIAAQGDPVAAAKFQAKTQRLATKLLEQSATLGVTCLSVVT